MTISILILTLFTFSYPASHQIDQKDILTSWAWVAEEGQTKYQAVHTFHKNGKYTMEIDSLEFNGQWFWTDENEIFTITEEIIFGKKRDHHGFSSGYYLRIVQLNDKVLKAVERHEGDAWDSGFAKERTYFSQNL